MRIRFFNAYETVMPFFRNLLPHLAEQRHDVEFIVSSAEYRPGRGISEAVGHPLINVARMPSLGLRPRTVAAKAAVLGLYTVGAAVSTLFGRRTDLNVFLTQPPLFPIWGIVLKWLRGQPYVAVVQDIHPDLLVKLGMLRADSVITRLTTYLCRRVLKEADCIVVIGRCMADAITAMGIDRGKIRIIHNWADEQELQPVPHSENKFRASRGWGDSLVFMYAGNLGQPQHFADILEVAQRFSRDPRIRFVFVGEGSRRKELEQQVESRQLHNIEVMPFQHQFHPLREVLSAGDVHLVTLKHDCSGLAVPSKSYSALAVGRPIIYQGDSRGEVARMVREERVGSVLDCGDAASLEMRIREYLNDPNLAIEQGLRSRRLVEGCYSRLAALQEYSRVLTGGAGNRHNVAPSE